MIVPYIIAAIAINHVIFPKINEIPFNIKEKIFSPTLSFDIFDLFANNRISIRPTANHIIPSIFFLSILLSFLKIFISHLSYNYIFIYKFLF